MTLMAGSSGEQCLKSVDRLGLSTGILCPPSGSASARPRACRPRRSPSSPRPGRQARAFGERDLAGVDYVYLWADGIDVNVRPEEDKLCLLVMIGVRADGRKELVALTDGYRESARSWGSAA